MFLLKATCHTPSLLNKISIGSSPINYIKTISAFNLNSIANYSSTPSPNKSSKVCIIGSGPAAMYTAQYILKSLPQTKKSIDIFEKLPVPFGLVRYGVAPDHQDVKNVINSFTETLRNSEVNFFGNVAIGEDLEISELLEAYNCVVLAYGSLGENYLNIPGEKDFSNLISAKDMVSWYNGLPGNESFLPDLSGRKAVIIGAGNVALDIARILLNPLKNLESTDISAEAVEHIRNTNKIDNVTIVARRGLINSAFTLKELRELTKIKSIKCGIEPNEDLKELDKSFLSKLSRPRKRLTEFMLKMASAEPNPEQTKTLNFSFLNTPLEILGDKSKDQLTGVKFQQNTSNLSLLKQEEKLESEEYLNSHSCKPDKESAPTVMSADLVIRSIGFKNVNIDKAIPFDKKLGVVINDNGKVIGKDGLYCTGWIKRGPRGVIVDTTTDANQTAKKLCIDLQSGDSEQIESEKPGAQEIIKLLKQRNAEYVDKYGWKRIDEEEIRRGKLIGKTRDKINKIEEMLEIANRQ